MRSSAPIATLLVLARAHRAGVRARVRYLDVAETTTTREIDVLGIAFQDGRWYALAHCHLRRALRMFRVDRIVVASGTRRRATGRPPRGFDPAFFATVEFLDPGSPVAHLATITLRGALTRAASILFPSAIIEHHERAVFCHVRASRPEPLAALVESLGDGATLLDDGQRRGRT